MNRWEKTMSIQFAVDRLYEVGWLAEEGAELPRLKDGRRYPDVADVKRAFNDMGLSLNIKQNLMFDCFRANWGPVGEITVVAGIEDAEHGNVVGKSEVEAAVFALAKLIELRKSSQNASMSTTGDSDSMMVVSTF